MCIQLMQDQIIGYFIGVAKSLGISNQGNQDSEWVKVTKVGKMKETPVDMTGNELDFNSKRRKKNMVIFKFYVVNLLRKNEFSSFSKNVNFYSKLSNETIEGYKIMVYREWVAF